MENDSTLYTKVQAPPESETIEKELVSLRRTWVFWENYEAKFGIKLDWADTLKEIFEFNELISFWQFWNNYPGSNLSEVFYNGERLR